MLQVRTKWFYFCIACVSLCVGYTLYFLGRPGSSIFAIPDHFQHWISIQPLIADISGQLPSFLHGYALILLIFLVLGTSSKFNLYLSISLWATVEVLFEVGQHNLIKTSIINMIPDWFERVPVLDISDNYFPYGTFDPLDLMAIAIGSVCAWLTLHLEQGKAVIMKQAIKNFGLLLKGLSLVVIFTFGLFSLLATTSSNDPGIFGFADAAIVR